MMHPLNFLGWVRRIFDDNDVVWQIGELGKVDQGGGGTVALEVARLNADVIDVGVPVLSMHSPLKSFPNWTSIWLIRDSRPILRRKKKQKNSCKITGVWKHSGLLL